MLAGKQPFRVENTASQLEQSQLVIRIITEPISDPRDHYPAIPQRFVDVIKRATEKKKVDRIQSIVDFEVFIESGKYQEYIISEQQEENDDFLDDSATEEIPKEIKLTNRDKILLGLFLIIVIFYLIFIIMTQEPKHREAQIITPFVNIILSLGCIII